MDQESKITEERLPEVGNPNPIVERKHINQIRKIAAKMKLDSQEKASKENQRNSPDMKDTKKNRPKSGYPRLKYEYAPEGYQTVHYKPVSSFKDKFEERGEIKIGKRKKKLNHLANRSLPKFELNCLDLKAKKIPDYNSLLDHNLVSYFDRPFLRTHLKRMRIINKKGELINERRILIKNSRRFDNRMNSPNDMRFETARENYRPQTNPNQPQKSTGRPQTSSNHRQTQRRLKTEGNSVDPPNIIRKNSPDGLDFLFANNPQRSENQERKKNMKKEEELRPLSKNEFEVILADFKRLKEGKRIVPTHRDIKKKTWTNKHSLQSLCKQRRKAINRLKQMARKAFIDEP